MVIDRSKHNKYSVNLVYTPSSTTLTEQQTALSGSSLTIYISGGSGSGSGLTEEQLKKLESIEEGALVNQNAFSTVLVSDGSITNEITAQNPSDTIKFTYVSPIKISLIDGNIQISYEDNDALWKLDEDGNLWTDRNVYSTKEISAYGFSEGGSPSGGANYLYELSDVDSATATSPIDNGILQYNAVKKKWVVTDGSGIKPDLTDYATKLYVTELINLLVGTAPDVLDTIYEIAEALNNDPDYVKDIANNLSNLTNRVVKLEDMFEWDNGRIKAKADLYGVGEIAAYGYSSGSPSFGAQYLSELLDVDLTNLADLCILQYNSITKKWEATDGSNIKPDLSAYATQTWVTLKIQTATESLRNEFNSEISEIENSIVTINSNITVIQGNITTINDEILAVKANITLIKNDISTIKQDIVSINNALDLLNKMFEWDGNNIKAKANLYSVGEISAYGYQDGSASSGVQYLHELLDVTLTELTSGLLLQWDGSKWININKDEVGLNESELLQYLTENNYAKKSDIPKVIDWTNITSKPSWITDEKPIYSWTDITNKPTVFTTNIENISNLNSLWDSLLKNEPTDYITRWPSFSEVTDKPTTLSGYGITDGVNSITLTGSGNAVTSASINGHVITLTKGSAFALSTHNHDSVYVNVAGDTMTGTLTLPTIVVNTRIQLGNAYIEYDSINNAVVIKNKITDNVINFYATGEVSAYGYNDGTEISGVTYLSELKDVELTTIAKNDILVWNGSLWTNIPMSEISTELTIDNITDLNSNWKSILKATPSSYVTRWPTFAEVTSKPTTLAGYGITDAVTIGTTQTITGNKTISRDTASILYLKNNLDSSTSDFVALRFLHGDSDVGGIAGVKDGSALYRVVPGFTRVVKLLDTDNFYSTLDTRYVKKTGDTMTGALTINATKNQILILNSSGGYTDNYPYFELQHDGVRQGVYAASANQPYFYDNGWKKILTEGNYSTTLDTRYVKKAGDTITGVLNINYGTHPQLKINNGSGGYSIITFQSSGANKVLVGYSPYTGALLQNEESNNYINIKDSNLLWNNLHKIWHAGNDGSGSGLDADLLDGYDSTGYCRRYSSTNSGTSGSSSWENKLPQDVGLWYGHESNVGNFTLFNQQFSQLIIRDTSDVYYRYKHWKDGWITNWVKLANITDNVASATKLQTPRTIWGQSFDGTANISGSLSTVGSITGAGDLVLIGKGQIALRYNDAENNSIILTANSFRPILGSHNNIDLGASIARWRNIYSVLGNFSGAVTFNGTTSHNAGITSTTGNFTSNLKVSGTSEFIGQTTHRAGIVSTTGSFGSTLYVESYLTANSGVIVPYTGSTWISMATRSNLIRSATNNSTSNAHALFRVKNSGGDAIVFGGLGTNCGFYGFTAEQISAGTNETNWSTVWDVATGKLTHNKAMSVAGAVTLSSTLSVTSTSIFTGKTTHNGGIQVNGSSFFNLGDATLKFYAADAGNSTGSETFCLQSCFDGLNGETSTYPNSYPTRTVLSLQPRGGYVGIGTVSPDAKFHVYRGRSHFVGVVFADAYNYNGNNNAGVVINKAGANYAGIGGNGTSNEIKFGKCSIDGAWVSESQNWNFEGNIVATGEITAYSSSDIRLKKNLKELKAINTLRKINTFEYDWTEEALLLKANKNVHDYGIIAQELELIIPEAVTHDMYDKGYLGIDYTKLIPFTISAIKEVDDEVTTLKKRVKELEDRLSKYESSVK